MFTFVTDPIDNGKIIGTWSDSLPGGDELQIDTLDTMSLWASPSKFTSTLSCETLRCPIEKFRFEVDGRISEEALQGNTNSFGSGLVTHCRKSLPPLLLPRCDTNTRTRVASLFSHDVSIHLDSSVPWRIFVTCRVLAPSMDALEQMFDMSRYHPINLDDPRNMNMILDGNIPGSQISVGHVSATSIALSSISNASQAQSYASRKDFWNKNMASSYAIRRPKAAATIKNIT